jgi:ABC-2 type transport system ATP-binding protein
MLEVKNLTVKIGDHLIVDQVSFPVKERQWLMIVGPNGAGKSTIVNAISQGVPYTGSILFEGIDIAGCKPVDRAKLLGVLMQYHFVGYSFTVEEVVKLGRYSYAPGIFSKLDGESNKKITEAMEQTGILSLKNQSVLTLSGGELQRTFLAQIFAQDPRLLILDEPTVGLDPKQIIEIRKLIKALGREHTIILSSHILPEVSAVCERVVIINKGEIAAVDTPENLSKGFGTASKLSVTIAGPKGSVTGHIKDIYGVKYVEPNVEREKDVFNYVVESDKDIDVRRPLFFAMAKAGYPIIELKSMDLSLEDIFLQIVTEEKEVG